MSELLKNFSSFLDLQVSSNVAQEEKDEMHVFSIVAFWLRFQELVSPNRALSETQKKARCLLNWAKVNNFLDTIRAFGLGLSNAGESALNPNLRGSGRRESKESGFQLSWLNRKLRENKRLAKDEGQT